MEQKAKINNDSRFTNNESLFVGEFPRKLFQSEKDFLNWILPEQISVYNSYRKKLDEYFVLAEGRRGRGNLVIGKNENDIADITSPLADVFAYGVIETSIGNIACTIREEIAEQFDIEIMNLNRDEVLADFEEARRWTYSNWNVGEVCPQCLKSVRMISMKTKANENIVLAICANDKRLWICEEATQRKRTIPVTNFYNELMFHKKIRDAKIALDSKRLFTELNLFTDEDLSFAFQTYNKIHKKVDVSEIEVKPKEKISLLKKIFTLK
ncbi:MAG: hypothetical protein KGZ58_04085 [Ignavibacteriales bacterium]|nr:hypothetical protein [Ignavibacteriales bacterium]